MTYFSSIMNATIITSFHFGLEKNAYGKRFLSLSLWSKTKRNEQNMFYKNNKETYSCRKRATEKQNSVCRSCFPFNLVQHFVVSFQHRLPIMPKLKKKTQKLQPVNKTRISLCKFVELISLCCLNALSHLTRL